MDPSEQINSKEASTSSQRQQIDVQESLFTRVYAVVPIGVTSASTRKRPDPGRSTVTTEPLSALAHVT
eukprot:4988129-Prymnesium_polylepis.1